MEHALLVARHRSKGKPDFFFVLLFYNASSKSLPPITLPALAGRKTQKSTLSPWLALVENGYPELGALLLEESSQVQSCVGNSALVSHADDSEAKI